MKLNLKYRVALWLDTWFPWRFCWADLVMWAKWEVPFREVDKCDECDYCGKVTYRVARARVKAMRWA